MADPATIAIGSMGMSAGGGVVGAIGNLFSGDASSKAYQYQAGVARMNAQISKQNADYSRKVGETEAQIHGMKTAQEIGITKAGQSGSGVSVSSGSAAAVRETQHEVGEFDQAMIRSNAARKAYGFEVEAVSKEAEATMFDMSAKSAETGGMLGAFTSLLSGASSVSSKWMQYRPTFGSGGSPSGGMGLPSGFSTGSLY